MCIKLYSHKSFPLYTLLNPECYIPLFIFSEISAKLSRMSRIQWTLTNIYLLPIMMMLHRLFESDFQKSSAILSHRLRNLSPEEMIAYQSEKKQKYSENK